MTEDYGERTSARIETTASAQLCQGIAGRIILICSTDDTLATLIGRNLAGRGSDARHVAWAACCGDPPAEIGMRPDAVVADLDCPEPDCWQGFDRVRARFGSLPTLFLTYGWPSQARLDACQPCRVLRKPFAIGELLRALEPRRAPAAAGIAQGTPASPTV